MSGRRASDRRFVRRYEKKNGETLKPESEAPADLGFKVVNLDASNFKVWDADHAGQLTKDIPSLLEYMKEHVDNIVPGAKDEEILFELMLKSGVDLCASREQVTLAGKTVYKVDGGSLVICLAPDVSAETIREIIALKSKRVICIDRCFKGQDALKTNVVLEMKSHDIQFQTA